MPASGQYGANPTVAQFQGFINQDSALVTRAAQNCVANRLGPGQIALTLSTGSVDDADYLPQVCQFDQAQQEVNVTFGAPNPNDILFTFGPVGAPVDPAVDALFNIVVSQCTDGVSFTVGNP
jgi:hypothetical protein